MALINYITQIQFDFGAIACLQAECERLGIKRPMIVTDAGVRGAGLVDRVLGQLKNRADVAVFDQTPSNPTESAARDALKIYMDGKYDGLIAIGGGSSMDLAKAVAVMSAHSGPLKNFAAVEGGAARITAATAPVIAIPTTAGTGSEVGRGAVLILDDGRKLGILSPHIVPKVAICDPELTLDLPAILTAATGMDAITHCFETFMAPSYNFPAEGIALDGLWRGWRNIEQATNNPHDREARFHMMSASTQGALAFQKGLGAVHSLSHSLGGLNPRLHHGTLNAMFLPAVIMFNASAESMQKAKKLERLAQTIGVTHANEVAPAVKALNQRLGLPSGLAAMGVTEDMFQKVIESAMVDHCHFTNPRTPTAEDYVNLLKQSM
ncbi:iron-containing alcohol dehydrogenase [Orrella sp. NBD-18]|uniref:Iron-containing alcohol dehydrogenase n=1 Tax=Sheuella amnicola TaxID=2707330 RepID=A0A6B2QXJ3_9BURK|nr:iron-containing alcohol dehydrogenase [Sheuella amnicola]NDY82388.1 iron-containing alcohol dehydrogenase [Sheuella amnicola]HBI84577.1 4-hydroxybutyrate dehydrogenase [Alcaligenaceae bacterium]